MHGYIDNKLTKAEWITALRAPEDRWTSVRGGQQWLADMMRYHTPDIADDHVFLEIPEFLSVLDRLSDAYVADKPHTRVNRNYIYSEWLQGHASESLDMAHDLAYTIARIGGPDLGVAVGAHVIGGWYQLSARADDFTRAVYEPLYPYIMNTDSPTVKIQFGDVIIQINLLMMGRTIIIIDKKRVQDDPDAVHLQLVGSSFAEGAKEIGLHLVDAPTLGAALGVFDETIIRMREAPQDPEALTAMLSEGRMWAGGVFTHA